ncbi:MAG TPA: hypothetical protein VMP08_23515 [Anaerolineae bacterium]|nr:hypothetical protein [Anaerolineae bacterium]
MKRFVGMALLVGIVAALGISSVASAQSSVTPTPTATTKQAGPPGGFGPRELHSQAALEAAAKALGMTADELSAELWGGKTLSDIATEKGVDIAAVKAAVEAAENAETKTAINQAVTDGKITQAKADWLIEGLDKGYWGAGVQGDFGFGMGPGMDHGGPRGGGPMGVPPSGAAPNGTTPNASPIITPTVN